MYLLFAAPVLSFAVIFLITLRSEFVQHTNL